MTEGNNSKKNIMIKTMIHRIINNPEKLVFNSIVNFIKTIYLLKMKMLFKKVKIYQNHLKKIELMFYKIPKRNHNYNNKNKILHWIILKKLLTKNFIKIFTKITFMIQIPNS